MTDIKAHGPPHSPRAEESIRHAHAEAYRLGNDPAACIDLWERVGLPFVAPALRDEARRVFRQNIVDPQFRLEFVLDAYQSALKLYEEGAFE